MSEQLNLPTSIIPGLKNNIAKYTRTLEDHASDVVATGLPARVRIMVSEGRAVYVVSTKSPIILGRTGSSAEVTVDLSPYNAVELGISRRHLSIEAFGDRLMAKDVGSVNGSVLNGTVMTASHVYELHHGDELKLGKLKLRLFFVYD